MRTPATGQMRFRHPTLLTTRLSSRLSSLPPFPAPMTVRSTRPDCIHTNNLPFTMSIIHLLWFAALICPPDPPPGAVAGTPLIATTMEFRTAPLPEKEEEQLTASLEVAAQLPKEEEQQRSVPPEATPSAPKTSRQGCWLGRLMGMIIGGE